MDFKLNTTTLRFVLLFGLSGLLLVGPFVVSTGFFTIDEVVYFLSAHAFSGGQGFFVDNGVPQFASPDLTMLTFLVLMPDGLTVQYPGGFAVVGSLFFDAFGARGLLLANALAGVGTLFVTHKLALRLFQSMAAANLAVALCAIFSFMPEYAVGYWPHMISVLSVTLALYLFVHALDPDAPFKWAFASGLVLGAGLLFRVDGLLLLSTIALVTALYASNPVRVFGGGVLGMLPGLALSSAINSIKFGTLNPISYGPSGEGWADPTTYLLFAGVAAIATLAVWGLRLRGGLPKIWALVLVGIAVAAIFALPQVERQVLRLVRGILALWIDSKTIIDTRPGVESGPDGTQFFWGMSKKALGQSLPWLGLIAALLVLPKAAYRRSISIVLIFVALWSLPFLLRSWHGGLGSNMRYLLPVLPALAALVGWIIVEVAGRLKTPVPTMVLGGMLAFGLQQIWLMSTTSGLAGFQQILASYVLFAVAIAVCVGLLIDRLAPVAGVAVGLGLGMAFLNGIADFSQSQHKRSIAYDLSSQFSQITDRVVVYGSPENVVYTPAKTNAIAAVVPFANSSFDHDFIQAALAENHRVIMANNIIVRLSEAFEALAQTPSDVPAGYSEIVSTDTRAAR
ncbi:MAG: hypothetical protein ABJ327_19675 [Litoreibacter sp.]